MSSRDRYDDLGDDERARVDALLDDLDALLGRGATLNRAERCAAALKLWGRAGLERLDEVDDLLDSGHAGRALHSSSDPARPGRSTWAEANPPAHPRCRLCWNLEPCCSCHGPMTVERAGIRYEFTPGSPAMFAGGRRIFVDVNRDPTEAIRSMFADRDPTRFGYDPVLEATRALYLYDDDPGG